MIVLIEKDGALRIVVDPIDPIGWKAENTAFRTCGHACTGRTPLDHDRCCIERTSRRPCSVCVSRQVTRP